MLSLVATKIKNKIAFETPNIMFYISFQKKDAWMKWFEMVALGLLQIKFLWICQESNYIDILL